ncbi:MAG: MFS transporter [Eubacteriales bacterium]
MKLNVRRTILVGFAFLSICAFWQLYDSIVPLILKNTFEISDTVAGVIMALDNVLALFMLPLFGMLSDRTNTRIGSRMPFIIGGTIAATILMVLLPIADRIRSLTLFAIALGAVLLSMSTYRSPAVALMPDVTPKPLRSKANAIINLMGAVGGIITLGLIAVMVPKVDRPNYIPLYVTIAAIMLICITVLFLTIKENKLKDQIRRQYGDDESEVNTDKEKQAGQKLSKPVRKSLILILASIFLWFMGYNAITTAFSKYANVYWGLEGGLFAYALIVAQVAAIISYIPVGAAATRFGRKKVILFGIILLALSFACAAFFKSFSALILLFFVTAGIAWASINVNSYPMVVEMSRGSDVGKYTGYYYTFSMAAQIVTPILSGAVLEFMGYKYLFPYGALFVALSFITMILVRHGDSRPEPPQSKLEAFDVED